MSDILKTKVNIYTFSTFPLMIHHLSFFYLRLKSKNDTSVLKRHQKYNKCLQLFYFYEANLVVYKITNDLSSTNKNNIICCHSKTMTSPTLSKFTDIKKNHIKRE